jgi:hypothetical protein
MYNKQLLQSLLRDYIGRERISLREVSRRTGLSTPVVSRAEKGGDLRNRNSRYTDEVLGTRSFRAYRKTS